MYKLRATILKDIRILTRDRVGLILMFVMPIVLAIVITAVQNSTFELVNDSKVPLLLCNKDNGAASRQLIASLEKMGRFQLTQITGDNSDQQIREKMRLKDALVAVVIPADFSAGIDAKSQQVARKALNDFGVQGDSSTIASQVLQPLTFYYHPVLQQSFRNSLQGALRSVLQLVESREIVKTLYLSLNEKELPLELENDIINNQVVINEVPVSRDGSRNIPNATQHNIPAWTVFAMFFVVISLGSSVVREKLNGSFVRLKTLPTSYLVALVSKQVTYMGVTLAQAGVIFAIGVYLFPAMGLPQLNLPSDISGLLIVTLICGWCAVSYAICIGVFAQTQEQANGFGAVTIVILAAIGGVLVPSFAMPSSFNFIMKFSPLHWCLEAYYGLFLEGGKLKDILMNILPLSIMIIFIQAITLWGLKRKNLI
ncbi:MAG: ABC transporter permease [Chitinophagaceae bacterium]|nr:ABC transporter permease [Chitinophagaceae bacterium]